MRLRLVSLLLWPLAPRGLREEILGDLAELRLSPEAELREALRSTPALAVAAVRRGDLGRCLLPALLCGPLTLAAMDRFWARVYSAIPWKEDAIRSPLAWVTDVWAITAVCLLAGAALAGSGREEARRLGCWTGCLAAAGVAATLTALPVAAPAGVGLLMGLFAAVFPVVGAKSAVFISRDKELRR